MASRLRVSLLQCVVRHYGIRRAPLQLAVVNGYQNNTTSRVFYRATVPETPLPSIDKRIGGRLLKQDLDRNNEASSQINPDKKEKKEVEETLKILKMKLERLGRLNVSDIERCVRSLKNHLEELTDDDCLKLLQFTLRMAEDDYRPCANVVSCVWMLCTNRSSASLTVEHFELYLRTSRLAESTCTSEDILSLLEKYHLEPSFETLELLILMMGDLGDLAGATSILTLMKQKNLPITETIFSALIMAHGVNKDCKGIESVYDAMRSVQITPTSITYEALVNAYGIAGQILQMKQVVAQMKQARVALTHSQLASLLLNLVKSSQAGVEFENMDYIVELMTECSNKLDLSRVVLQMIHCGHVREAVHLLPTFPLIRSNNHLYSNALVYIREMVYAHVEPCLLVEMCKELQHKEINLFALQVALEYTLREKREKLAWALLKAVKESGSPIRQHYFWPLFHMNAVASEPSKLIECVHEMLEMGESPSLETLKDHVIPGLTVNHPNLTMKMLNRAGLTVTVAATPLLIVLIKNNMYKQAFEFVKETKVPFSLRDLTATLARSWSTSPRAIITLLALLINKNKENSTKNEFAEEDWGGQFLLDLATSRTGLNDEQICPLFEELRKNNIGISENSADLLMTRSNRSIQQAIRNNISIILNPKMGQPPKEQEYNILPHPKSMSTEELDGHMVELQAKSLNVRGTLRKLLLQQATKNETENVLSLMEKAKEDGIKLSAGMMASILMAYVTNKNVEAAMNLYSTIQVEHPSFSLDSYKVIDLCTLLVENGRSQEAVAMLRRYLETENKKTVFTRQIRRNCRNLLMAAASTCNYELTKEIFDTLVSGGLMEPDNLVLGTLVNTAVDLLEQMLNIIAQFLGSKQAKHDLLFACLEAKQPNDARKVLQSLGEELDRNLLNRQFDRYSKLEQDEVLLHFLTASRGNNTIDRHRVFSSLLNIYYVQSAGAKGMSLWTMMQEEDLSPSQTFLTTLASLLASNNMKIPFQIQ
ncbi:Leucine-rich PPR motif-containing protein-like 1 [Homarus americanus]|uniref:Leucine-rich PPR motif-containing protein-like 1 n=1 Tax=Homarus americanus TaxID=6706 RepID=A0A8J5N6N0_HOMAM|nr:Leucine-rich PPR motif-containing protein-like 1 [Homarus americanus]